MAEAPSKLPELVRELNDRVYKLLRLDNRERILVEDFVQVKASAIKGKFCEETAGRPRPRNWTDTPRSCKPSWTASSKTTRGSATGSKSSMTRPRALG